MSDQTIITALQIRLESFATSKGLLIAYEGARFAPAADKMHLAEFLLPVPTDNPSMGRGHRRYTGTYQVDVDAPTGSNIVTLRTRANELAAHFKRGTTLTESGVTVLITHDPAISRLLPDAGRMKRAVSIRYQADIFT